jgi:hypothetical protein
MKFARIRPSDFVRQLTIDGIPVSGVGSIPLTQYLCSAPEFRRDYNAEDILGPLRFLKGKNGRSIGELRSYDRVVSGQGYPEDIKIVMEFIANNLSEVKKFTVHDSNKAGGVIKTTNTYSAAKKYFANGDNPATVLNNMVKGGVFGLDCIGFVSQYLIAAGIWDKYKTYYPKDYVLEFKPVKSIRDIRRLSVVIWGNYHIAIINKIHDYIPNFSAPDAAIRVDICQSSGGGVVGPQVNKNVLLKLGYGDYHGAQLFRFMSRGYPELPVFKDCYIANMPELSWVGDWLGTKEA